MTARPRVVELMRAARPVLLDLAYDPAAVRAAAGPDVKIVTAACPDAPADALFVRPDGVVSWRGDDPAALREAIWRHRGVDPGCELTA